MTYDPKRPHPADSDSNSGSAPLDESIRRALDPPATSVERVARRALRFPADGATPAAHPGRRWAIGGLALAATVVLVTLLAIPMTHRERHAVPAPPAAVASPSADDDTVLTISNASGVLSVTTTAGTRWILLPGDTTP